MENIALSFQLRNRSIEIDGTEILHFEKHKIKEGWTMFNMAKLIK